MSRQLTFSAVLSAAALAALALVMTIDPPARSGEARPATAHGSIVSVLLRA
jgi:hypothetical protein